jgi:hypothetical protein
LLVAGVGRRIRKDTELYCGLEFELELIQLQLATKPMMRAEVYARALRASQNVKRAEVWVGARCASLLRILRGPLRFEEKCMEI